LKIEPIRFGNDLAKFAVAAALIQSGGLFKAALRGVDLVAFWAAGKLAWMRSPDLAYSYVAITPVESTSGAVLSYPFLNPPPFLLLFMPFSLASYPVALAAWAIVTLLLYIWVVRRLVPDALWLMAVFPPVLLNLIIGQNGLLTASLFIAAVQVLERKPAVAGILIGALVIKPQLAVLIPIALLAGRHYRAFAVAGVTSISLIVVSELLLPGSLGAFLSASELSARLLETPAIANKLHSVYASVRLLGAPASAALLVQAAVSVFMAILVWKTWRTSQSTLRKGAVLAAATPLATPYVFDYDLVLLILPLAVFARSRPLVAAGVFVGPALTRMLGLMAGIGLGPVIVAAALWASVSEMHPKTPMQR
jgi:hypothetical protein